jgi:hypothetical protein
MSSIIKWILGWALVLAVALSAQAVEPIQPGLTAQIKKIPAIQPSPSKVQPGSSIAAQKTDLAITSMAWSNPVKEGAKIGMHSILNLVIANHGAVETQPTTVQFTCTGGCPAMLNGSRPVPNIPAGKNVGISWPDSSQSTWPSGTFTLEAVVDPSNQLADSNRMNNRIRIVFTVVSNLPAIQQKGTLGVQQNQKLEVQQSPITGAAIKPTIKVNQPAGGEVWRIDTPQTVSWIKIGDMGPNVSITLLSAKGNVPPRPVVVATPNSGSYTIPAGFFNGMPLGDYSLRVQTTDNNVVGNSGLFRLAPPPLNIPKLSHITVLEPVQDSRFQEGGKITVRFESNITPPFQFELVESGSQKKVMNSQVGSVQQQGANIFSADWTIPEWDYSILTKYRLRVSKGGIEGFSAPFVIQNVMKTTTYEIPATTTVNKLKSHHHKYDKNAFSIAVPAEEPDPGPRRLRVGYLQYSDSDQYFNCIYRSWAFFDLSSLKGKGLVTKASLQFTLFAGSTSFIPAVQILNDKWSGDSGALFSVSGTAVSPSALPINRITNWIVKDENYGVVFIGPNENLDVKGNTKAIGMYDNVKLVVEMTK